MQGMSEERTVNVGGTNQNRVVALPPMSEGRAVEVPVQYSPRIVL